MENEIRCPRCGSTQVVPKGKGFSTGKALAGGALFGIGGALVGGMLGSGKLELVCLKCGKTWKPKKGVYSSAAVTAFANNLSSVSNNNTDFLSDDTKMMELINSFKQLVGKSIINQKFFEKTRDKVLDLREKVIKTMAKKKPDQKLINTFIAKVRTISELVNVAENKDIVGEKHIKRLIKDL